MPESASFANDKAGAPTAPSGSFRTPVRVPPAKGSLVAIELVNVFARLASLPKAASISTRVSKAAPAPPIRLFIATPTNSVVANRVLEFPSV